jgi:hypothetical protein
MWPTASALASVAADDASALDEPGEDALDGLVLGQATQPAEIWQFLPEAFRALARARALMKAQVPSLVQWRKRL